MRLVHNESCVAPDPARFNELCLWVHPMLAGVGTLDDMVFSDGLNKRLEFGDANALASGVVLLTYRAG